ncbi:MAG TPA: septum formation initiator family protein [Firmicutes bacterium]|nr:septum formation initiator family protein [Bacillota bacterium]
MKAVKRKKKSVFLRVALAAFSVYVVVMLVQLQLEITDRQDRIAALDEQIRQQELENDNLQKQADNYEYYQEQKAREQGYARPGETIYKER